MKTCNVCDQQKPSTEFVFLNQTCRACQQKRKRAKDKAATALPLPCFVCGATKQLHRHHVDYDQPLSVVWLCEEHHNQLHREHGHEKSAATQNRNRSK